MNCKYYKLVNDKLKCVECIDGHGLYESFSVHYCGYMPENCLEIDEPNKCSVCKDGYANINYKCQLGEIYGCETYNSDYVSTYQICSGCVETFYLDDNECKHSNVKNC